MKEIGHLAGLSQGHSDGPSFRSNSDGENHQQNISGVGLPFPAPGARTARSGPLTASPNSAQAWTTFDHWSDGTISREEVGAGKR